MKFSLLTLAAAVSSASAFTAAVSVCKSQCNVTERFERSNEQFSSLGFQKYPSPIMLVLRRL